jgi:tRNA-2-methylthio-N6-dimethylallyladenosine synthase
MYLYVHTIGCQMNVYDSQRMSAALKPLGYQSTENPEDADLILVNTCSVRKKAEQKAFSFLGRMAQLKKSNPGLIIGVGGCVAQQEADKIFERTPEVDLIFGTHAIDRLPEMVTRIKQNRCHLVDISMAGDTEPGKSWVHESSGGKISEFVTIMQGCDNYCTYCVVPFVRGPETSRRPDDILNEIVRLVDSGVKEVVLLGQNVNSYGIKQGLGSFPDLLEKLNTVEGLLRIRFTTSHPKDLSVRLIDAFTSCEKVCRHIHLPFQSGSNRILTRMNRKYSRENYLDKIRILKQACPDIAISSDVIVGFPGETQADFDMTLDLLTMVRFDSLFAFKYSDRPFTRASGFKEKISEEEKTIRIHKLIQLQKSITLEKHQSLIGSNQMVLVEGFSKNHAKKNFPSDQVQWTGRTVSNAIVNFSRDPNCRQSRNDDLTGQIVGVRILDGFSNSLRGILEDPKH